MIIDKLIDKVIDYSNPTVVGLDTCVAYLPEEMQSKCNSLDDAAKYIKEFNFNLIDAIKDIVPAVKVQVAYYEMYGPQGMQTFADTLKYAKDNGLFTIADVKRNDIGSTAGAYSKAYLSGIELGGKRIVPFESDFITVNGYLGSDGINPFVADAEKYDKGLFVLVKTSNPTSGELQDKQFASGNTLYEEMGELVTKWGANLVGKYGYSGVGAVVGATHREQAKIIRDKFKSVFFLIPGYGAQGGKAEDLAVCFENGIGGVVNSSRGILTAYQKAYKGMSYVDGAKMACDAMQKDLISVVGKYNK